MVASGSLKKNGLMIGSRKEARDEKTVHENVHGKKVPGTAASGDRCNYRIDGYHHDAVLPGWRCDRGTGLRYAIG